jgi:microcystin-dependent protein
MYVAHDLVLSGSALTEPIYGWLWCNGATIANSGRYAALYAHVGSLYGGAGKLPTIVEGIVPIPKGSTAFPTAGVTGGEITHVTTLSEYPAHTHPSKDNLGPARVNSLDGYLNLDGWPNGTQNEINKTSSSVGGGGAHPNMPPYQIGGYVLVKL